MRMHFTLFLSLTTMEQYSNVFIYFLTTLLITVAFSVEILNK